MSTSPAIEEEIILRGYNSIPKIIKPTLSIIEILHTLDTQSLEYISLKKATLKNTKNSTISFYEAFFELQRVPFFSEKKFGPIKIERQGDIHPFALPLKQIKDVEDFFGRLDEIVFLTSAYKPISYKSITLSKNITEITKLAYTHEIAHTQLTYVHSLVGEYYNSEVISIFLELVHALELQDGEYLLNSHDLMRFAELKNIIEDLDQYYLSEDQNKQDLLIEASLYLQSTLEAYNLFIKYYYGNNRLKKEILATIQRLFNQELTLEELLDKFDITFENSQNPKQLSKYIKR